MVKYVTILMATLLIVTSAEASNKWWHILGEEAEVLLENMFHNNEMILNLKDDIMISLGERKVKYMPSVSLEATYRKGSYFSEVKRRISLPIVFKLPLHGDVSCEANIIAARIEVNNLVNELLSNYVQLGTLINVKQDIAKILSNFKQLEKNYRKLYLKNCEYGVLLDEVLLEQIKLENRLEDIKFQMSGLSSDIEKISGMSCKSTFSLDAVELVRVESEGRELEENLDVVLARLRGKDAQYKRGNYPEISVSFVPFTNDEIECEYEVGVNFSWNIFDGRSVIKQRLVNQKEREISQKARHSFIDRDCLVRNHNSLKSKLNLIKQRKVILDRQKKAAFINYEKGGNFHEYIKVSNLYYQCQIEAKELCGTILTNYIKSFQRVNYDLA